MTIASGFHLFPFRTEKLSLITPMVLRNSGRVGSRRFFQRVHPLGSEDTRGWLVFGYKQYPLIIFLSASSHILLTQSSFFRFYHNSMFDVLSDCLSLPSSEKMKREDKCVGIVITFTFGRFFSRLRTVFFLFSLFLSDWILYFWRESDEKHLDIII